MCSVMIVLTVIAMFITIYRLFRPQLDPLLVDLMVLMMNVYETPTILLPWLFYGGLTMVVIALGSKAHIAGDKINAWHKSRYPLAGFNTIADSPDLIGAYEAEFVQ